MAKGAQDRLASLRKSALVRDDSGDFRVYRDEFGSVFHSVTHILKETSPEHQKQALERWLARPTAHEDRDMAAKRGTLAHEHAEYLLKTAAKIARQTANKRNSWRTSEDGLERCPGSITRWGIQRAIQGAPRVPWSASGYARGLRGWIADNCSAIHACEFSIHHSAGMLVRVMPCWTSTAKAHSSWTGRPRCANVAKKCSTTTSISLVRTVLDLRVLRVFNL